MKHPYQGLWSRIAFCVRRNGLAEVFLIPLRMGVSPVLIPLLPRREFPFEGRMLAYGYHRYNVTWANERALEIPIARAVIEGIASECLLEVGNVLSHYLPVRHTVLDKFEAGAGVVNEDILSWNPGRSFDLILSVSTYEHIGFDDDDRDPTGARILEAIQRSRGWLNPGGRLVLTAASGYNPAFDALVAGNRFGADRRHFYWRATWGRWEVCDEARYLATHYNRPHAFGNALVVAEFPSLGSADPSSPAR